MANNLEEIILNNKEAEIIPELETPSVQNTLQESPLHDSSSVCSPEGTSENELEHDADSDSSCSGEGPDVQMKQHRTKDSKRKTRRTSSNVFIARKLDNNLSHEFFAQAGKKLTEFEDDLDEEERKHTKQVLVESYSSSTDENELTDSASASSTLQYEIPSHIDLTESESTGVADTEEVRQSRKMTAVDGLLFEIYDRFHR